MFVGISRTSSGFLRYPWDLFRIALHFLRFPRDFWDFLPNPCDVLRFSWLLPNKVHELQTLNPQIYGSRRALNESLRLTMHFVFSSILPRIEPSKLLRRWAGCKCSCGSLVAQRDTNLLAQTDLVVWDDAQHIVDIWEKAARSFFSNEDISRI